MVLPAALCCCVAPCNSSAEATAALPSAAEAAARVAAMQAEKQLLQQQLQEVRRDTTVYSLCSQVLEAPSSVLCTRTAWPQQRICQLGATTACAAVQQHQQPEHSSISASLHSATDQQHVQLTTCWFVPSLHVVVLSLPLQLQQQRAAVVAELQARQAAADDVLQQFDKDIAEPVDKVRDSSSILLVSSLLHITHRLQVKQPASCMIVIQ